MCTSSHFPWFLLFVLVLSAGQAVAQPTVVGPYQPDSEPDGLIGMGDLLSLLGQFGTVFDPEPVTANGAPFVEVWEEECTGDLTPFSDVLDADVGTMAVQVNGHWVIVEEAQLECPALLGCTDPEYVQFDPLANEDDGSCTVHVDSTCVSPTLDGYTYAVVEIGEQCWFAENLRTRLYANGDSIPGYLPDDSMPGEDTQSATAYGEGNSLCLSFMEEWDICDETLTLPEFGLLYTFQTVVDPRGVCPSGWHLPYGDEWVTLFDFVESQGYDGNVGTALKTAEGWDSADNVPEGEDAFGFAAKPGGYRHCLSGDFADLGEIGLWWTATSLDPVFRIRVRLSHNTPNESVSFQIGCDQLSVRCLRDAH